MDGNEHVADTRRWAGGTFYAACSCGWASDDTSVDETVAASEMGAHMADATCEALLAETAVTR